MNLDKPSDWDRAARAAVTMAMLDVEAGHIRPRPSMDFWARFLANADNNVTARLGHREGLVRIYRAYWRGPQTTARARGLQYEGEADR